MEKTNVMRILDNKKINYMIYDYSKSNAINGMEVANYLGENPNEVFKTLVTIGKTNNYYVFVLPVNKELDLKKASKSVGEKNVEMIKSKDLLNITGYIHGGCSPIGMKKNFKTVIDISASNKNIIISGGKIGKQIKIYINDLKNIIDFKLEDISENIL